MNYCPHCGPDGRACFYRLYTLEMVHAGDHCSACGCLFEPSGDDMVVAYGVRCPLYEKAVQHVLATAIEGPRRPSWLPPEAVVMSAPAYQRCPHCAGRERRVVHDSFGLVGHRCPECLCVWDPAGPLQAVGLRCLEGRAALAPVPWAQATLDPVPTTNAASPIPPGSIQDMHKGTV